MTPCPINPSLSVLGSDQASVLGSCFPLPLGGGGTTSSPAIKKKKRDEDASTLPDLFRLLYHDALRCASRRLLVFPPLSLYLLRCLWMPLWFAPPKKKTTHERCTCYAASLSAMVEPDSTFLRSSTCCSRWIEVCGEGFW